MQIEAADIVVNISPQKLVDAINDAKKSARIVKLTYVCDSDEGIVRVARGKSFTYKRAGKQVKDNETLARIKGLVIPPAWQNVWICSQQNGHLQCTGVDLMGRKQYRYHPLWSALRKETKFYRLLQFGQALKSIRKQLSLHLSDRNLSRQKVLAAVVSVMDKTGIRVGNSVYEKLYGSFGLSTLKDQHIKIKGNKIHFSFRGKKGVYQNISLKSARLAKIIKECKEIPGKELFQYMDESGGRHSISSGEVNDYIKDISGGEFTSKDFRTWTGTIDCLAQFTKIGGFETQADMRRNTIAAIDGVAANLGNTRTVCKSHYIHPLILTMYEDTRLMKYMLPGGLAKPNVDSNALETTLIKILKKEKMQVK